jgi:hypothetical protein
MLKSFVEWKKQIIVIAVVVVVAVVSWLQRMEWCTLGDMVAAVSWVTVILISQLFLG